MSIGRTRSREPPPDGEAGDGSFLIYARNNLFDKFCFDAVFDGLDLACSNHSISRLCFIDAKKFPEYHASDTFWITPVVAPAMILELLTTLLLFFYHHENIDSKLIRLGLGLTLIVWASTFLVQVPLHEKLALGFDASAHSALVNTNWIRTAARSLPSILMLSVLWKVIRL